MASDNRKNPDCQTLHVAGDLVLRRAAKQMIDLFAQGAGSVSVHRAGLAFERGDMNCVESWLRIARNVQELERIGSGYSQSIQ